MEFKVGQELEFDIDGQIITGTFVSENDKEINIITIKDIDYKPGEEQAIFKYFLKK